MKTLLWLACLLPIIAFADPPFSYTEEFCNEFPTDPICVGFNIDRAEIDSNDVELADHEVRITDLENVPAPSVPFVAKLEAEDSVGTTFNSFVQATGTGNTVSGFTVYLEQSDGTFATVTISPSSGIWDTGDIRYSGTDCTGTMYFIASWAWNTVGSVEGAIVISSRAGFDGIPYTFNIGPLLSDTIASRSSPGHPISAPVCEELSPVLRADLRLAIPVQGLPPVVVPPVIATIQLAP